MRYATYWIVMMPVIVFCCGRGSVAQDYSQVMVHAKPVADHLFLLRNAGGNILLSVGEDGALLVDAGMPEFSKKIGDVVAGKSGRPLRYIVNTHWHFDHTGGNSELAKGGAVIIAHGNVRKCMSEHRSLAGIDRDQPPSPKQALPVVCFEDSLALHVSGEEILLEHVANAHTDGDTLVYFRKANVLHMGDVWFNGMYPFMDVNANGCLAGMIEACDRGLAIANSDTKIVPGHGPVGDRKALQLYRDALSVINERIVKMVSEGKSKEEAIAAKPTAEYDDKWGKSWLTPDLWVSLVYDGIERTKE